MKTVISDPGRSAGAARAAEESSRGFRTAAGRFATGVAVATSQVDGSPVGMTVNSFATVSLDPMLLLVCLCQHSRLLAAVTRSGVFAVTVLAADQRACARWFASPGRPAGPAEFAGVPHHTDPRTGCPLLSDGLAYFGCTSYQQHESGDHVVLIGRAQSWGLLQPGPPLLFADGGYCDVSPAQAEQY